MKKVLILSSSPRRGGNSDTLCDDLLRGARDAGHEAEKIFLRDLRIGCCNGCGACSRHGLPCPQRDDAAAVIDKMVRADAIVLATPVYFYTMSAQLKTLIDRCCSRYTEMSDKEFCFLVTAAEEDRTKMLRTVDSMRGFLDCLDRPKERGTVFGLGVWHAGEIERHPARREAYELGRAL